MSIGKYLRGDRRFWSPIAITCGLAIFFFGLGFVSVNAINGYIDIAVGLILLIIGFLIAPYRAATTGDKQHQKSEVKTIGSSATIDSQVYLQERKSLFDALLEQSRSFDKYILILAGGSFGLSLLFMRQIIPEPKPETVNFLITAWGTFGASILLTLLSFLFSQVACLRQIQILDKRLKKVPQNSNGDTNVFTIVTQVLNWMSMLLFISGVILLISFASQNMQ